MKTVKILLVIVILFGSYLLVNAQVAINTDGSTPDASAMLDVKSTAMGMLIPRMTTTQRTGISPVANGLMVFDTSTKSFWFYEGSSTSWTELVSSNNNNEISDADNDTYVIVEQNSDDDTIRHYINGVEKFRMTSRAMEQLNTGKSVFIGDGAGSRDDMTDNYNVFIGQASGHFNTSGMDNTAMGNYSLWANTIGIGNTAIGSQSMQSNISGNNNTAYGTQSLFNNSTGRSNVAIGIMALYNGTNNRNIVAIGDSSLYNNGTNSTETYHATKNTAVGSKTLYSNTSGYGNTAQGYEALYSNTTGYRNVANGMYALYSNTTGYFNVANGCFALMYNTTGGSNVANGYLSLNSNTTGQYNTASGYNSLYSNKANTGSVAYGYAAMENADDRTTGRETYNTAIGYESLRGSETASSNTGRYNTSVGYQTLYSNITGHDNTAVGSSSLNSNSFGYRNTAVGSSSLYANSIGSYNTANGYFALANNTSGSYNVAFGDGALFINYSGNMNVGIGAKALQNNYSGNNNTAIGYEAGGGTAYNKSGSVFLGYQAGYSENTSNKLYIENSNSSSPLIYGEFDNDLLTINGRLGVGSNAASNTKLSVSHDNLYAGQFTSNYASISTRVIIAEYTSSTNADATAIYGKVQPNANSNYGYGGHFLGNYMAVNATSQAGSSVGSAYGVHAICDGSAGTRYGVYAYANGPFTIRYGVYGKAATVSNSYALYCDGNGVYTGTWSNSSDRKLKKNIEPMQNALEKINLLQPSTYEYRTSEFDFMHLAKGKQNGFVAQDMETVFPELVSTVSHPKSHGKETDIEKYKAINYIGLIPVLTQAIKEQQQTIDELKSENTSLQNKFEMLEQRLTQLEKREESKQ